MPEGHSIVCRLVQSFGYFLLSYPYSVIHVYKFIIYVPRMVTDSMKSRDFSCEKYLQDVYIIDSSF